MQLNTNLIRSFKIEMVKRLFLDTSAELDEKALLIALFVIAAIVGLSPLGAKVAHTFRDVAAAI
jgi:Flp pilus assembly pilin Flp